MFFEYVQNEPAYLCIYRESKLWRYTYMFQLHGTALLNSTPKRLYRNSPY